MNAMNKMTNAKIEWEKAQEVLREAKILFDENLPGGTISRAYYAAFHAATALLILEGLEVRSHQALGKMFSLHFVKPGILDPKFSRILSMAQKLNNVFTMDDAKTTLDEVQELCAAAEGVLKDRSVL